MGKVKLEKGKKTPMVAVDAPKDRVKTKLKQKSAKKLEKPILAPPADTEIAGHDDSDEAPEAIPIAKVDQAPPVTKNKNKKKKKNKKGQKEQSDGSLLKIKDSGKIHKKDELVEKVNKISKKLKNAAKNITPKEKDAQIEDPADPPEILATKDAIRTAVIALRKATEEEAKDKKKLFDKDFKYCLQLCATKIPKVPTRLVRL